MRDEAGSRRDNGSLPRVEGFEDLVAWQKARALVKEIHALTEREVFAKKYAFGDQLQRAGVSVMSNIAEGFERGSRAEFFHMLSIAKGSCAEVRSLPYVALDAGYIDNTTFSHLNNQAADVSRIILGLRASVGRQRDEERMARH